MTDVAELAGVSNMTVSRVLNNSSHVSEEARSRVLAAVEQLQYRRNEVARSLREQTSRQIGILVPNISDPFFATCAHGIGLVAKKHSYSVVLSTSDEDAATEYDEASRMVRRNVDGLVLIPTLSARGKSRLMEAEFEGLPIVTVDRPVDGSEFDGVMVENREGSRLGTDHLIGLGHKEILFISLERRLYTMRMREQGYKEAMQAAKLRSRVLMVPETAAVTLSGLKAELERKNAPTAVLCANNLITRNVLHSLHAMGKLPPEDLALVGFDDFDTADLMRPGITVVRQPVDVMGRVAGELLFSRIGGETSKARKMVYPVELVVRGSCGAKV